MFSPSPVSLAQYAVLSWVIARHLLKKVEYKRVPRLVSLVDGFFVVAFFVVVTDAFWCLFCILRWLPLFPNDLVQIVSSFFRDVAGAALFFLLIGGYFRNGVLDFKRTVPWLFVCFVSQGLWFLLAPSLAFTDYVYAFRHGFSLWFVLGSFVFSHFVMRLPLWVVILKSRGRTDVKL